MKAEQITPKLVLAALDAWQHGTTPSSTLLELRLIRGDNKTTAELSIDLHRLCRAVTIENLLVQRQLCSITTGDGLSAEGILHALQNDFQASGKRILHAWSALYYRYIVELHLDIHTLASAAGYSTRNFRRYIHKGAALLASTLREIERGTYAGFKDAGPHHSLPPAPYHPLYGFTSLIQNISDVLLSAPKPAFISLEGMAGSGKTMLAREVVRHLAKQNTFQHILWVSAQPERFTDSGRVVLMPDPVQTSEDVIADLACQLGLAEFAGAPVDITLNRLHAQLRHGQTLVVLDHLDALPDDNQLLSYITQLSDSTQVLITSRCAHSIYSVKVPDLSYDDSAALVQSEMRASGRTGTLDDRDMEAIYDTVGGLPLALRFIAKHMIKLPLYRILDYLQTGHHPNVDTLYSYLYWHSWQQLSDSGKRLLQRIPATGLDADDLVADEEALVELIDLLLLHVSGTFQMPQYHVHCITQTFTHTEIMRTWQARLYW